MRFTVLILFAASKMDFMLESHVDENETEICKFGNFTLKRGDQLISDDKCLKCECAIPPFITCIKNGCQ